MGDEYNATKTLISAATRQFLIVPSDTQSLAKDLRTSYVAFWPKALYILTDGTLRIVDDLGVAQTYPVTAGQTFPFRPVYVLATGTTCTLVGIS